MVLAIIISLGVGAVGGFFGGILVGRKNAKTVESVVSTAKAVTADVKKI